MSEPNNVGEKTLTVSPKTTLSLKRPVEQGTVRQSFSHGRTKQVVVEKVKRRVLGPGEAPARGAHAPAASTRLRPVAAGFGAAAALRRPAPPCRALRQHASACRGQGSGRSATGPCPGHRSKAGRKLPHRRAAVGG